MTMDGIDLSDITRSPLLAGLVRLQHSVFATRTLPLQRRKDAPGALPRRQLLPQPQASDFGLRLENLPAAVLAGLDVDVVGAAALAGILVLDVGRGGERVMRTAHASLHARYFLPRNCHRPNSVLLRE